MIMLDEDIHLSVCVCWGWWTDGWMDGCVCILSLLSHLIQQRHSLTISYICSVKFDILNAGYVFPPLILLHPCREFLERRNPHLKPFVVTGDNALAAMKVLTGSSRDTEVLWQSVPLRHPTLVVLDSWLVFFWIFNSLIFKTILWSIVSNCNVHAILA